MLDGYEYKPSWMILWANPAVKGTANQCGCTQKTDWAGERGHACPI